MVVNLQELKKELLFSIATKNTDNLSKLFEGDIEAIEGSANEIHNFVTDLARVGFYGFACKLLDCALIMYPNNSDLLGDYLSFGMKCNRISDCERVFAELDKIKDSRKTWRAFVFSVDYLLLKIELSSTDDEMQSLKKQALSLIQRYKKVLPNDEKAFLEEYKIYEATYDVDTGLKYLEKFLKDPARKVKKAPSCYLKFIDAMLERGEHEKVIIYANKGVSEAAQEQEPVDTGYFFYASALAKDAIWHVSERLEDEADERAIIEDILRTYQTAYDALDEEKEPYFKVIEKRYKIIVNLSRFTDLRELKKH